MPRMKLRMGTLTAVLQAGGLAGLLQAYSFCLCVDSARIRPDCLESGVFATALATATIHAGQIV